MFDKLIASEPDGSDVKNRRSYFMVSSLVVGILFLAAVVFSIYASDYGLGHDSFEISMVMAPTEPAADPEPPKPQIPSTRSPSQTQLPRRIDNIARVDEPTIAPRTISTTANEQLARPTGQFTIGKFNSDTSTPSGSSRDDTGPYTEQPGLTTPGPPAEPDLVVEPPPIKNPVEPKPMISLGVITGKATYLPKPAYPPSAVALSIQGKVDVQVMIDENGKVISANAVSGNKLLRAAAEVAARNAKFDPTYLSKVPVKVTGVIVYNFSR